jgi:hypothetical protein
MSDLAELTGAPRADVLPGYTLSMFGLSDFGEAQREFEIAHVAMAGKAAIDLPKQVGQTVIDRALNDVAEKKFAYGKPLFDRAAFDPAHLPALLHICLKTKHPNITRGQAKALLTRENEYDVQRSVLEQMGFDFEQKPKNDQTPAENQSTGGQSLTSSAPTESSAETSVAA